VNLLKNLHQADQFNPSNSYAVMQPKNSWEKIQETQRYCKNSNCCITVDKLVTVNKEFLYACTITPIVVQLKQLDFDFTILS